MHQRGPTIHFCVICLNFKQETTRSRKMKIQMKIRQLFCVISLLPLVLFFSLNSRADTLSELSESDHIRFYLANNPSALQFLKENALMPGEIQVQQRTLTNTIVSQILNTSDRVHRVTIEMITAGNESLTYTCDLHILFSGGNGVSGGKGGNDFQNINLSHCEGPGHPENLSTQ